VRFDVSYRGVKTIVAYVSCIQAHLTIAVSSTFVLYLSSLSLPSSLKQNSDSKTRSWACSVKDGWSLWWASTWSQSAIS